MIKVAKQEKGVPKSALWYSLFQIFKESITCIPITIPETNDHMERSFFY
ncbi:hypothetical protein ACXM0N_18665 [Peribacillus simplex]